MSRIGFVQAPLFRGALWGLRDLQVLGPVSSGRRQVAPLTELVARRICYKRGVGTPNVLEVGQANPAAPVGVPGDRDPS
jgi:hypothetical protein